MRLAAAGLLLIFVSSAHAQHGKRINTDHSQSPDAIPGASLSNPMGVFASVPEPPAPLRPGNPVPVNELLVPPKALKEYERSQKAFQAGDVRTSAVHLQKAIEIYPKFVRAHDSLGLRYLALGDYKKALEEFQAGLALDSRDAHLYQDLGFTLLVLGNSAESEAAARRSLELDPKAVAARYVLGRALVAQLHVTPEAKQMLLQSEGSFANASLVLAHLYFREGHTDQVVDELRNYLRGPGQEENRQKAECWLAQLTNSRAPAACSGMPIPPNFQ